jgi:hypothetical protein
MEINLEHLKKNFLTIKDIRGKVTNIFTFLEGHLLNLKETYAEFVENNRQNLFVFGLDSFQFQSKLIDIEYEDTKRLFYAINNRMYCEYYKLYKIIADYIKENIHDKKTQDLIKITNIFPVYKDLEPYKQYKFEIIQEIHENIILLLYGINEFIMNKESELQTHKKKQDIGLNINNFVTTFNYNIIMIREKGMLFISYIKFFHNLHTKYLQRFAMKMELMFSQVTHDIRFEDAPKLNKTKKKELIKNYEDENIDNGLILKIKRSFDDSDSNSSSDTHKKSNSNDSTLSIKNKLPVTDDSTCLVVNSPIKNENELTKNNSSPKSGKYKNIFKKNVKKIMDGMSLFRKNKDIQLSTNSSESSLEHLNDEPNIEGDLTPLENNIELKVNEDESIENINKTKSAEEMFMEISKQCNLLTDTFILPDKKDQDIISMELLDIYDSKNDENIIDTVLVEENIKNDAEDIEERVLEDIINYSVNKKEDENMSVITMDYIYDEKIDEKIDEIVEKREEKVDEKIVDEKIVEIVDENLEKWQEDAVTKTNEIIN